MFLGGSKKAALVHCQGGGVPLPSLCDSPPPIWPLGAETPKVGSYKEGGVVPLPYMPPKGTQPKVEFLGIFLFAGPLLDGGGLRSGPPDRTAAWCLRDRCSGAPAR